MNQTAVDRKSVGSGCGWYSLTYGDLNLMTAHCHHQGMFFSCNFGARFRNGRSGTKVDRTLVVSFYPVNFARAFGKSWHMRETNEDLVL